MKKIVINWENDLIDEPEKIVSQFASDNFKAFELKMLSGLKNRSIEEIYETLEYSFAVIMQPSLFDEQQVRGLISNMAHSVYINFHSNTNNLSVRHIVFISTNPFEDLREIKRMCIGLKDNANEQALVKILKSLPIDFYGFNHEHYVMCCDGFWEEDIYAKRIN